MCVYVTSIAGQDSCVLGTLTIKKKKLEKFFLKMTVIIIYFSLLRTYDRNSTALILIFLKKYY